MSRATSPFAAAKWSCSLSNQSSSGVVMAARLIVNALATQQGAAPRPVQRRVGRRPPDAASRGDTVRIPTTPGCPAHRPPPDGHAPRPHALAAAASPQHRRGTDDPAAPSASPATRAGKRSLTRIGACSSGRRWGCQHPSGTDHPNALQHARGKSGCLRLRSERKMFRRSLPRHARW